MEGSGSTRRIAIEGPDLGNAIPLIGEIMLAHIPANIGEGHSRSSPALATSAFLLGSSMDSDQAATRGETDLPRLTSAELGGYLRNSSTGRLAVSIRGTVFRSSSSSDTVVTHHSTGDIGDMAASEFPPLQRQFSLRGELMHCFISYRVACEGPSGNGLSGRIAAKIRSLSLDVEKGLQIPHHGR